MSDTHTCKRCQMTKSSSDWYHGKNGRDSMCKDCRKSYRKEEKRIHSRKYCQEHREHYLKLGCEWREKNVQRKLWLSCKHNAKKRNIEFNILPEDIVIPVTCPVLGVSLDTAARRRTSSGKRNNDCRPSIDRFDNNRGYDKDNIRVISWRANSLKKNGTVSEFEKILKYMKGTSD